MKHGSSRRRYVVYETLNKFFQYYLTERDPKKTLSMVTDDVYSLGTGRHEVGLGKEEMAALIYEEMSALPEPFKYTIRNYREKQVTKTTYACFCDVTIHLALESGGTSLFKTRLTAGFIKKGTSYLAYELHLSEPSNTQEEREFFPMLYGNKNNDSFNLSSKRELVQLISEYIPGGIMGGYVEPGFPLYVINQEMLDILGYEYDEFIAETGELMENTIHPHDRQMVYDGVKAAFEVRDEYKLEYRVKRKDGSYIWVFDVGRKIITDDGRTAIVSILIDISANKAATRFFMEAAMKDALTGLCNRRALDEYLKGFFENNARYSLLMIDVDSFKKINDLYGHTVGDVMLKALAGILRSHFREKDILVRLGGDEFVVMLPGHIAAKALTAKVASMIEKYKDVVARICPKSESSLSVAGIRSERKSSFEELFSVVDKVLYEVKSSCTDSWKIITW